MAQHRDVNALTIDETIGFFKKLKLTKREETIAHQVSRRSSSG